MGAMTNLAALPNHWNPKTRECKVIVETPKGRRNKFAFDPEFRLFELKGLLPEGLSFPYDFGFIPSTLGGDGDPLDVLVLMDEPAHVGCLIDVRLIGVIEAVQTEGKKRTVNDRLIGVAVHSYAHEGLTNVSQLNPSLLDHVQEFFIAYNKGRGKRFEVKARRGPGRAAEIVERGQQLFTRKNKK